MSSRVSKREKDAAMELFSVVCRGGGVMELSIAVSKLSKKNKSFVKSNGAKNFINSFSKIFKVHEIGQVDSISEVRLRVEAMMPLTFCPEEASKASCPKQNSCIKLHLCPYFIRGKCTYGDKCRCSHDIKDVHTRTLLFALDLEDIDEETWLQLLKKIFADTHLERGAASHACPDICKFYNNQGACREGEKCPFLHVCKHFVEGTCKFGDGCKRDHDVLKDKHNCDVFEKFNLGGASCQQLLYILRGRERKRTTSAGSDASLPGALPRSPSSFPVSNGQSAMSMRNVAPISPQGAGVFFAVGGNHFKSQQTTLPAAQATSTPEKKSSVICGFYLKGQCNYGEKCMNQHRELPYQWQLMDTSTGAPIASWKDLSEDSNARLECDFSDPSNNSMRFYHQGQSFKTDFDKLTAVAEQGHAGLPFPLRRLSTESSTVAPPGHIFSTRWLWYWQDETDKWQTYDCQDDGYEPNTTCSKSLEKDFLDDKESHPFSAGHHKYTLNYKEMFQQNNSYKTEKPVRRRPEFVDKGSMKEIAKRRKVSPFPSTWDPMPDNTAEFIRVPLSVISQEYKDIEKRFLKTLIEPKKVTKIERIQNPDLWTGFTQKKGRMSKKASDVPPKEMEQLFHGTATDVVDAICQQGFDWRMHGKHGHRFGKGSYFAETAGYSHRYTGKTTGIHCHMFVARVLVGSYVVGESSFTRPPPKDPIKPHGDLYDSCVNESTNPSVFVIFDNSQSYPEYLITYKG